MRITILFGGTNKERLVSVASAQALHRALPEADLWFWHVADTVHDVQSQKLLNHARPFEDEFKESSTTPMLVGERLLASSISLGSVLLELPKAGGVEKTPVKVWENPDLTCYFSTPIPVGKDHIYVVTGTKPKKGLPSLKSTATLWCIDAANGKPLWKRENVGKYHASLLRTGDDKLLILEEAGNLVLLDPDPKEYRELARAKVCEETWAHPALSILLTKTPWVPLPRLRDWITS